MTQRHVWTGLLLAIVWVAFVVTLFLHALPLGVGLLVLTLATGAWLQWAGKSIRHKRFGR